MVERDVVLAKAAAIDASLARIEDVRGAATTTLRPIDIEDIVVLNLQRAAQAAIDLATHVVATEKLGLPSDLANTFTLLEKQGIIEAPLGERLRKMVGFRNVAVHQYQSLDPAIVESIVTNHLHDFRVFAGRILQHFGVS